MKEEIKTSMLKMLQNHIKKMNDGQYFSFDDKNIVKK